MPQSRSTRIGAAQFQCRSGKGEEEEENKGVNLVRSSLKGNDCAIPAEIYRMRSSFHFGAGGDEGRQCMPRGRPSVTHFFPRVQTLAVFACESTDEKTDEHLKSRRRAEQMRITDSVAMAARRRRTRIWVGRGRSGRVPADFEGEEESCERERRDRRMDGQPRCRQ